MSNVEKSVIISKIDLFCISKKYLDINIKKRKIAQVVEHWFPKPKARGSNPFFPVIVK